jgi:hypothetical protein
MKKLSFILVYFVLSIIVFTIEQWGWFLTCVLGPIVHLNYAFHEVINGREFLDGIARPNYLSASIFLIIWIIGFVPIFFSKSKISLNKNICLYLVYWGLIGLANIYLYGIKSV